MASILKVDTIQDQAGNNIISENANVITIGASGDTITVPAGATVSGFTSAGIDDNATSTAITIDSSQRVGIGIASPTSPLMVQSNEITPIHVKGANTKAILVETTGGATEISTLQLKNSAYTWNVEGGRRANTLTFYAGTVGGERMCIDGSSGNVGIGTSSPGAKLEIQTGSDWGNIINSTYTGTQYLQQFEYNGTPIGKIRGDNSSISIESGSNLILQTANTERMRIDSSGNVGIGDTSPNAKLDVRSQINVTNANGYSLQAVTGTRYGYSSTYKVVLLGGSGTSTSDNIAIGYDPSVNSSGAFTGTGSELLFRNGIKFTTPNSTDTGFNINHLVLKDGNVGIGTSSPSSKLHVNGNFTSTGIDDNATSTAITINSNEYVGINTTSPARFLHITGNDGASGTTSGNSDTQIFIDNNGGNGAIIEFGASNTGAGSILFSDEDASNRGKVQYFHSSNSMVFSTNASEAMRINSSGTLLVGTTSLPRINSATAGFDASTTGGTNSTTLADQKATVTIDGYIGGSNTNGDTSILCLTGNSGAASRPGNLIRGYGGNNAVNLNFEVQHDGDVLNANNSYGSISDERVKQNIIDAPSSWNDIKNIRVRKYKLNSDIERYSNNPVLGEAPYHIGVISQEIETVSPGLIKQDKLEDGTPDENSMKHVKYSVLYMKAVKALQEAMERIETLEAKVQTLETNQP